MPEQSASNSAIVTVTVTANDIAFGKAYDSEHCPIALALRREHPRAKGIAVGGLQAWFVGKDWNLDRRARRFVKRFDHDQEVRPNRFTLARLTPRQAARLRETGRL